MKNERYETLEATGAVTVESIRADKLVATRTNKMESYTFLFSGDYSDIEM